MALSLLARWLLDDVAGDRLTFSLTISALLPLVLLVRPGPFFAAAVLGWVGSVYLFVPPSMSLTQADSPLEVLRWAFAAVMGLAVVTAWLSRRAMDARQRALAALHESESRLRIAKAAARLGLHDLDMTTGRVEWDPRMRELWGVEPDEPITYELWRDSLHPDDREAAEAAEQALVDADRRKDEFLATLSHELRNPLGAIRMALGVLTREDGDSARASKMRGVIDRQSSQLERLIDDLLDVSRVTRGKVELRLEHVNLAQVIEHAVEGVHELCEGRGLRLALDLPTRPVVISADPLRFAQVVSNLLNNACKFTEAGGEVVVSLRREGEDAVVRVRDTGVGIPPEKLPHVFELYAQVDNAPERREGGLGIGLSLTQSIVAMHGGTISAASAGSGCGSEFTVRVPARDQGARPAPADHRTGSAPPDPRNGGGRILAVDDNRDALAGGRR